MEVPQTTDTLKQGKTITPEVTWAQRSSSTEAEKNHIFLTIAVPDVDPKKISLDVQPTHIDFTGYSETKKANYRVHLDFYADIDPTGSKINHTPRDVEMVLQKKELQSEYWPRLLKEKVKVHFLKTDFNKWVDEDEQDAIADDDDYMSRMGGMAGAGGAGGPPGMMPGMGMGGGDGGFGGIDFSKLGGMPGMDALGAMGGMGGMGGEGEDEDEDEEMPGLEGEEDAKDAQGGAAAASSSGASSSKIEEVE